MDGQTPWASRARILIVLLGIGALALWASRSPFQSQTIAGVMGTDGHLILRPSPLNLDQAMDQVRRILGGVEAAMSVHLDDSELSGFNRAEPGAWPFSPPVREVLEAAKEAFVQTQGAFDVTCGPLLKLWKEAGKANRKPEPEAIVKARELCGWRQNALGPAGALKHHAQARFDLGGIAKGYGVDRAISSLRAAGIRSALLVMGGDTRCFGHGPTGKGWLVGIRHPIHTDRLCGKLRLEDRAVCTSGSYFRFQTIEGHRFSHIVDPRSGWPVEGIHSCTVIAPTALLADIWATALMVLGREGCALLPPKTEALVLWGEPEKMQSFMTPGFSSFLAGGLDLKGEVKIVGEVER